MSLATHLLFDGFHGRYELAVAVQNDGDLKETRSMPYGTNNSVCLLGVLNPHRHRNFELSPPEMPPKSFYRQLTATSSFSCVCGAPVRRKRHHPPAVCVVTCTRKRGRAARLRRRTSHPSGRADGRDAREGLAPFARRVKKYSSCCRR